MNRVVYDSEAGPGARCPMCAKRADRCTCTGRASSVAAPAKIGMPRDGLVRILRDRKRRGGKTVTVVTGLPSAALEQTASELKRQCGSGGTVKGDTLEIQGDHRERIAETLRSQGFVVKLAGA